MSKKKTETTEAPKAAAKKPETVFQPGDRVRVQFPNSDTPLAAKVKDGCKGDGLCLVALEQTGHHAYVSAQHLTPLGAEETP